MKLHRDNKAQVGTLELVTAVAIGLIVLAAIFSLAPVIGDKVDSATTLQQNVAATGTVEFSGNTSDGETVNISTDRYEFDTGDGVAGDNFRVNVSGGWNTSSRSCARFAAEVTANDSIGVGAICAGSDVTLTADVAGSAGNSITTTETGSNIAVGATLTGGTDASEWSDDDVPTGVDVWKDNASLISLVVLVMIISLAIFYIRRMGGGGGGGM